MEESLVQEFNDTAAAAHEAFPDELKRLVILLVPSSDTPVYVSPEVAAQLTKNTAVVKEAVAGLAEYMQVRNWIGMAGKNYRLDGTPVNLIALDDKNVRGFFSSRHTKEMRALFVLDHEIGHHILKNGLPPFAATAADAQLAEGVADVYAMLRHIQRFGKHTDHAGSYAESRACSIVVVSDTEHYTTNMVQRAIQIADERGDDIFKLSLHETAALAEEIATDCRTDDKTLKKIRDAYLPVAQACEMNIGSKWDITRKFHEKDKEAYALFCRETLAVMDKYGHDPHIFKAGKQFLSYPPVKNFMIESAKTDIYWKEALGFAGINEAKAPKRGLLRRKRGPG